jgi:hypothetical protein
MHSSIRNGTSLDRKEEDITSLDAITDNASRFVDFLVELLNYVWQFSESNCIIH